MVTSMRVAIFQIRSLRIGAIPGKVRSGFASGIA
jgi:hypothetical protein